MLSFMNIGHSARARTAVCKVGPVRCKGPGEGPQRGPWATFARHIPRLIKEGVGSSDNSKVYGREVAQHVKATNTKIAGDCMWKL